MSSAQLAGVTASISTGFGDGRKQIQLEFQGPDIGGAAEASRIVPRPSCARCPARSTSGSRPRVRSRSSTSRSTAAWPDRLGVTIGQVGAGAAAGVCRDRRRRLDRSVGRDARCHRAAGAGVATNGAGSRVAAAVGTAARRRHDERFRWARSRGSRRRSVRRASITSIASGSSAVQANTEGRPLSDVIGDIMPRLEKEVTAAGRLHDAAGRRDRGSAGGVRPHPLRARRGGHADVLRAGRAVRIVPRSAVDPAVAAAVADWRHARPAGHRLDVESR